MSIMQPITIDELPSLLPILLANTGEPPASSYHVHNFQAYLTTCPVRWQAWRFGSLETPQAIVFALILPGRTAIIMVPPPGEHGIDATAQKSLLHQAIDALSPESLHYLQALIEPEAEARIQLLEHVGFRHLAPLVYLQRKAVYPWAEPPADHEAQWIQYSSETHAQFCDTLTATYEQSLDCPELTGLRPIDDIIAAHQASGVFSPELWELVEVDGQPAGCLLLSSLTSGSALDVVYMGVAPAYRGRGLGALLLRRALAQCRRVGARDLTLVVDDRNTPAKRLYDSFQLEAIAHRTAYLHPF